MKHTAHQYALDVVEGSELSCRFIQLACERYLRDLETAESRGLEFKVDKALHAIAFFHTFLHHSKGEFAGQRFVLEPWQQFQIWNLFGWYRVDGHESRRRFRISYTEIPRKNGKTTLAAGINLYMTFAENEAVAEGYFAATKRDQAKVAFDEADRMVTQSTALKKHLKIMSSSIFNPKTKSRIMPLSSDTNSLDALNIHCGIIDELHAHKTDQVVNVLRTSTGSRRQPMIYEITTAGTNKESICYNHRQYSIQVLEGKVEDDGWFALIYTLDPDDDWRDPKVWRKANPSLGSAKKKYYLEDQVKEAQNNEAYQNDVKRLDFNLWEGTSHGWLPDTIWRKQKAEIQEQDLIEHFECAGGLDIAAVRDFSALGLYFWNESDHYAKVHLWCPERMIDDRVKRQNVNFNSWVRSGWIRQTQGDVMDTTTIAQDVVSIAQKMKLTSIAYDKMMAYHGLVQAMSDNAVQCSPQPQSIMHMSEPTKMLERLLRTGTLKTDGNPVMDWMLQNVYLYIDPNGNYKLNKGKSIDKIDGVVAMVMAIAEKMAICFEDNNEYDPLNDVIDF